MRLARHGRHWAVLDGSDALVCLTVYKKGGQEVIRRLTAHVTPGSPGEGAREPHGSPNHHHTRHRQQGER